MPTYGGYYGTPLLNFGDMSSVTPDIAPIRLKIADVIEDAVNTETSED